MGMRKGLDYKLKRNNENNPELIPPTAKRQSIMPENQNLTASVTSNRSNPPNFPNFEVRLTKNYNLIDSDAGMLAFGEDIGLALKDKAIELYQDHPSTKELCILMLDLAINTYKKNLNELIYTKKSKEHQYLEKRANLIELLKKEKEIWDQAFKLFMERPPDIKISNKIQYLNHINSKYFLFRLKSELSAADSYLDKENIVNHQTALPYDKEYASLAQKLKKKVRVS